MADRDQSLQALTLPLRSVKTLYSSQGAKEEVLSRTLLIEYGNSSFFTLYIESQHLRMLHGDISGQSEAVYDHFEPVFLVPHSIDEAIVERIVNQLGTDLLRMYLVRQDT
jgi:hypothetical protein